MRIIYFFFFSHPRKHFVNFRLRPNLLIFVQSVIIPSIFSPQPLISQEKSHSSVSEEPNPGSQPVRPHGRRPAGGRPRGGADNRPGGRACSVRTWNRIKESAQATQCSQHRSSRPDWAQFGRISCQLCDGQFPRWPCHSSRAMLFELRHLCYLWRRVIRG